MTQPQTWHTLLNTFKSFDPILLKLYEHDTDGYQLYRNIVNVFDTLSQIIPADAAAAVVAAPMVAPDVSLAVAAAGYGAAAPAGAPATGSLNDGPAEWRIRYPALPQHEQFKFDDELHNIFEREWDNQKRSFSVNIVKLVVPYLEQGAYPGNGLQLIRAYKSENVTLLRLLLQHGANPDETESLASPSIVRLSHEKHPSYLTKANYMVMKYYALYGDRGKFSDSPKAENFFTHGFKHTIHVFDEMRPPPVSMWNLRFVARVKWIERLLYQNKSLNVNQSVVSDKTETAIFRAIDQQDVLLVELLLRHNANVTEVYTLSLELATRFWNNNIESSSARDFAKRAYQFSKTSRASAIETAINNKKGNVHS